MTIGNPKRRSTDSTSTSAWYPYYAGFSGAFAADILRSVGGGEDFTVLDPWNGSGTTTAQAARQGVGCIGVDINPVMTVVAKARCLSRFEYPSLEPLSRTLLAGIQKADCSDDDPLLQWFSRGAISTIRGIEDTLSSMFVKHSVPVTKSPDVDELSPLACFFYLALFRTVRHLLRLRYSSNPTWLRKSAATTIDLSQANITEAFERQLTCLLPFAPFEFHCLSRAAISVKLGTSLHLPLVNSSIDLVLTSPPYCTRIDYAVSTSAELALLRMGAEADTLRRSMMGTTTVPHTPPLENQDWGRTCLRFLESVRVHASRASSSYYYKNHVQYFDQLFSSLAEIMRVLRSKGTCCLVVQDSYYKEIHNDLIKIVREMGSNLGFTLTHSVKFPIARTLAAVHPGVKRYRQTFTATEAVLVFSRA